MSGYPKESDSTVSWDELRELVVWCHGACSVLPEDHPTRVIKEKLAAMITRMVAERLEDRTKPVYEDKEWNNSNMMLKQQLWAEQLIKKYATEKI